MAEREHRFLPDGSSSPRTRRPEPAQPALEEYAARAYLPQFRPRPTGVARRSPVFDLAYTISPMPRLPSRPPLPIPGLTPLWSSGEPRRAVRERSASDCAAVHLAWVLVGGQLSAVSAFAHLAPRARPEAACPVCRESVILKLGRRRAHHAAHAAGSRCPVLAGETALHVNTKCHLAYELEASLGRALRLRMRCGARTTTESVRRARCEAVSEVAWVSGWERVAVELALDGTRPDIALLRDDRVVAAIEVVGTNPVSEAKARLLASLGIPWIEVGAHRDLYGGLLPWSTDAALPVRRHALEGTPAVEWRCASHAAREARARRRRENSDRPWRARIVDRYLPDGTTVRDVFHLEAELRAGRVAAVRLLHSSDDDVVAKSTARSRDAVMRELHAAFVRWCSARANAGERLDSPMPWVAADRLRHPNGGWRQDPLTFPRRYRFVRQAPDDPGAWVTIAGVGEQPWELPSLPRRSPAGNRAARA